MSKFTINAALALLRFALNLLPKITRVIYAVMDLVDDGCLNSSVSRPEWMASLQGVIDALTSVGSDLTQVEIRLSDE
jgi:hypothetical protein